jgi:hypothetical protein
MAFLVDCGLRIADCGFAAPKSSRSAPGCVNRRDEYRNKLIRFVEQVGDPIDPHQSCVDRKLDPKRGLIGLFLNDSHLGNEIGR